MTHSTHAKGIHVCSLSLKKKNVQFVNNKSSISGFVAGPEFRGKPWETLVSCHSEYGFCRFSWWFVPPLLKVKYSIGISGAYPCNPKFRQNFSVRLQSILGFSLVQKRCQRLSPKDESETSYLPHISSVAKVSIDFGADMSILLPMLID